MNGDHSALWSLIDRALDEIGDLRKTALEAVAAARAEARDDIAALRGHVNTLLITIVAAALGLGAVVIGAAIWLAERVGRTLG